MPVQEYFWREIQGPLGAANRTMYPKKSKFLTDAMIASGQSRGVNLFTIDEVRG